MTITNLFEKSQLAEAAYADFSVSAVSLKDALIADGFSETQAAEFAATWEVVDHLPDTASSDFSAMMG